VNSVHHFGLELFKKEAGDRGQSYSFQGDAPGVVGVMGGHVDAAFLGLVAVAEHMKGGTMKGLVMTTSKRVPQFPNLPTMAEKGSQKRGIFFLGEVSLLLLDFPGLFWKNSQQPIKRRLPVLK